MSQSLFCARCALEAPLGWEDQPCTNCGWTVFVPARWLDWNLALTENDKRFLKKLKIATT